MYICIHTNIHVFMQRSPIYMDMCVHMYIHIHSCTHIFVYIYILIYTYTLNTYSFYICTHTPINVEGITVMHRFTDACVYTYFRIYELYSIYIYKAQHTAACIYKHTFIYICIVHVCMYVHVVCMYIDKHIYVPTHIYAHMHTYSNPQYLCVCVFKYVHLHTYKRL